MKWTCSPGVLLAVPLFSSASKAQDIVDKSKQRSRPPIDAEAIRAGLESRHRALYIKAGWIRDPYTILGPDDYFHRNGTQPNASGPNTESVREELRKHIPATWVPLRLPAGSLRGARQSRPGGADTEAVLRRGTLPAALNVPTPV